jgi:hypothetical protein
MEKSSDRFVVARRKVVYRLKQKINENESQTTSNQFKAQAAEDPSALPTTS